MNINLVITNYFKINILTINQIDFIVLCGTLLHEIFKLKKLVDNDAKKIKFKAWASKSY